MVHLYVIRTGLLCLLLSVFLYGSAQDSSGLSSFPAFPDKIFDALERKTTLIESKLNDQTSKYLSKLQKQEVMLQRKLSKKDSMLACQLFNGVKEKYNSLKENKSFLGKYEALYSGHLDSLSTAISFLKSNPASYSSSAELQRSLDKLSSLQNKLNVSQTIQNYLNQRRRVLQEQFERLGMVKELRQFRKQVYYYQDQIRQYKQAFEDPSKLEQKLLDAVTSVPRFKEFFAKNSMLASLFALPSEINASANLQGLQTRAMVNQSLTERFGAGPEVVQQLQQNLQSAQSQLVDLKSKLSQYTSGSLGYGSSDQDIPDFKVNPEKTKSFLKRLEAGCNIQSQRARNIFPRSTDFGLSLGYKLNQNSVAGIGVAAGIGWGNSWNHISVTYQGISGRTFIDWKLKGSFYISGGYEMNYLKLITTVDQLKNYSAWQKSGLIGLSKRYTLSKKLKGDFKVMWDFLSYQQVPHPNPFIIRIGYSLK